MNKKVIFVVDDDKLVDVLDVKTVESYEKFTELVNEAKQNKKLLKDKRDADKKAERDEFVRVVGFLDNRVSLLELEISLLKGEINDEEYEERKNELCGTK